MRSRHPAAFNNDRDIAVALPTSPREVVLRSIESFDQQIAFEAVPDKCFKHAASLTFRTSADAFTRNYWTEVFGVRRV